MVRPETSYRHCRSSNLYTLLRKYGVSLSFAAFVILKYSGMVRPELNSMRAVKFLIYREYDAICYIQHHR